LKSLTLEDCSWIVSLCDFYELQDENDLLRHCYQNIENGVTSENWFEVMKLAIDTNDHKLKQKALSVIPSTIPSQHLLNLCLQLIEDNHSLKSKISTLSQRLDSIEALLAKKQ